ncbi:HvfC/BufC N-terminal domain-containing protein [Flavimaricola marinus]|uniref:Putative DNA-binding domain-containing protein n=1 Tax=Flavimaricola marinus TaxID=1819565 RepID=A0A238LJ92_9RHOB|nr:DNA-binding domain-containing protein [Flavimaricola marinus]SMY09474.1 hypothetical protein LOM8899_03641 [Flavimaricola marinus]
MSVAPSDFTAGLLDPDRPAPNGLTDAQGRPAGKRFDVYRNNVNASLIEALEQGFPVIYKLVGRDFFRAMAAVYLRAHPPTSPLMMHYGAEMAGFLETFPPAAALPYLPDIARLECAIRRAYHAADATPIAGTALAEVAPDALPQVRFRFAPAVQIIASAYPIHGIWRANSDAGGPAPVAEAQAVLVARPDMDPTVSLIPGNALPVMTALLGGTALGAAFDQGGAGFDPSALLTLLLTHGAITALT